jgi:hypothetical protein
MEKTATLDRDAGCWLVTGTFYIRDRGTEWAVDWKARVSYNPAERDWQPCHVEFDEYRGAGWVGPMPRLHRVGPQR